MSDEKPYDVNDPDYDDPIVAEVRRIRAEMEAEWNHDLSQAVRYFEEQRRLPDRGADRSPAARA
jgi:hypothetical protein